jgi:hypothetical protein
MNIRPFVSLVAVVIIGLAFILGCRFLGKSCTGELTAEGRTFTGSGRGTDRAKQDTCRNYCMLGDRQMDVFYYFWLGSPDSYPYPDKLDKAKMFNKIPDLKKLLAECVEKCTRDSGVGGETVRINCK